MKDLDPSTRYHTVAQPGLFQDNNDPRDRWSSYQRIFFMVQAFSSAGEAMLCMREEGLIEAQDILVLPS